MGLSLRGYAEGTLSASRDALVRANFDGCVGCLKAREIHFARDVDARMLGCGLHERPISAGVASDCPNAKQGRRPQRP